MKRKKDMMSIMNNTFWDLPTSTNMTYFWNFGSILGIILMSQVASGFILTMFYTSYFTESFQSIVSMSKEIWMGWIIRMTHMNGASMFFVFIFLHLFRGMFFMSSSNKKTWLTGVTLMLTLMGISFLGYVLPWGQMSYWAVAVITNLLSILPVVGANLVEWIWGGYSVGKPTLMRFYSLHFLLPMILTLLVMVHLAMLHKSGSSNSTGMNSNMDKMQFHPFFTSKDIFFIATFFMLLMTLNSTTPYFTLDPVNNVPANPMQTPLHIQPEWYFLPFYAILRAMPSKTSGVISLVASVVIFMVLATTKFKFSTKFNYKRFMKFWLFVSSFFMLMKMGSMEAEEPYILMSKIWSTLYFISIITLNF